MKALLIRSAEMIVEDTEYADLKDLQRLVGGHLEFAMELANGDILYIDEEGKLNGKPGSFTLPGGRDLFVGDGVLVGAEKGEKHTPPKTTIAELTKVLTWHGPFAALD